MDRNVWLSGAVPFFGLFEMTRKYGRRPVKLSDRLMAAHLGIGSLWPFCWWDILERRSTTILYAETKFFCVCYRVERPMSALGQKRTCAAHKRMSALPPKADMCTATRDVR